MPTFDESELESKPKKVLHKCQKRYLCTGWTIADERTCPFYKKEDDSGWCRYSLTYHEEPQEIYCLNFLAHREADRNPLL